MDSLEPYKSCSNLARDIRSGRYYIKSTSKPSRLHCEARSKYICSVLLLSLSIGTDSALLGEPSTSPTLCLQYSSTHHGYIRLCSSVKQYTLYKRCINFMQTRGTAFLRPPALRECALLSLLPITNGRSIGSKRYTTIDCR